MDTFLFFQVASCEHEGMFMMYPRSYEEMAYTWRWFKQKTGAASLLTYSFALGFIQQHVDHALNKGTYLSVDNKTLLTSPDVTWFVSENTTGRPLLEPIVNLIGLQYFTPEAGAQLQSYQDSYQDDFYMCFYDL